MEKYKIIEAMHPKDFGGLVINFEYTEEGIAYAEKHGITQIRIHSENLNLNKQLINFNFFREKTFIKRLEYLVPLKKKSDISFIYDLINLEDLRWKNPDFALDFSRFKKLKTLNVRWGENMVWHGMNELEYLQLTGIKTKDLSFLEEMKKIEMIRIIRGNFTSLAGIEKCQSLKYIFLQGCTKLQEVIPTLQKMPNLKSIIFETCNKVEIEGIEELGIEWLVM